MSTDSQVALEQARIDVNAIREETLVRLGLQQNAINYTFVFLGIIGTVLGLDEKAFPRNGTLLVLLVGPILCIFLEAVYLKHQLFIEIISRYITEEVYPYLKNADDLETKSYRRWEIYLAGTLQNGAVKYFALLLGAAEAFFPLVVGFLCLIIYGFVVDLPQQTNPPIQPLPYYSPWWYADIVLLIVITLFAGVLRWETWRRHNEIYKALQIVPPTNES